MAFTDYGVDGLLATTIENYANTLEDQIFGAKPLMHILKSGGRIQNQTGESITQQLLYAEAPNKGSYSDDDTFTDSANTGIGAANFPWKQYFGTVKFTGIELAKNSGPQALMSLLNARMTQLEMSMVDDINEMLFSDGAGNSGKDFNGLEAVVDSADPSWGDFGGIDRATYTWWQADEVALGGALTLAAMRTSYNNPSEGRDEPTNIVTTQAIYEDYEALLDSGVRYEDRDLGDAGFQNLMFKGAPIVFDRDNTSGVMYFLNINYLTLNSLDGVWFKVSDWLRPVNQDVMYKHILLYGNFVASNCARQSKLTGIT